MAEKNLLDALQLIYKAPDGLGSRLELFDIHATLVSDTIIIWSSTWRFDTWLAMHTAYQVLATELGRMGLPIRGALSKGSFRLRVEEPRIIIGEAIVFCANLEKAVKAFMVVLDDSVLEAIATIPIKEDAMLFRSTLTLMGVPTDAGLKKLFVLKWMIATVPHSLHVMYRRLVQEFENGNRESILDLMNFLPKFLNSREMIRTLVFRDSFRDQVEQEWSESIAHAEKIWPTVFERGRQELERMENQQP